MSDKSKKELSREEIIEQNKQLRLIAIIAIIAMVGFMIIALYGYVNNNYYM